MANDDRARPSLLSSARLPRARLPRALPLLQLLRAVKPIATRAVRRASSDAQGTATAPRVRVAAAAARCLG